MARLLLATRNEGKLAELQRVLAGAGLAVELLGLRDVGAYDEVPETGATFAANALLKARAAVTATGLPALADDSGLCVDALAGMPGVLSARWAGDHGDDAANIGLLLGQLADTPAERRGAHFLCAAAIIMPAGEERVAYGRWPGAIETAPRGAGGFGYDPVFMPVGGSRTSAELSAAEKDAQSHRGRALRALVPHLTALMAQCW